MSIQSTDTKHARCDVEILCILMAVGRRGCRPSELPGRLGLSPSQHPATDQAAGAVIARGLLALECDVLRLTTTGDRALQAVGA